MSQRVSRLSLRVSQEFTRRHGRPPDGVFMAPGRVNLIGEHTDYNDGFVLPLALAQCVVVAAGRADGDRSSVGSLQQPGPAVTFAGLTVSPGEVDGWAAYVAGVFWALGQDGHRMPEFDLVLDGGVPLGAGLSSSAAVECGVALALVDLAGLQVDADGIARVARRAENDFVGAPTGVMDQMASVHGRADHLIFIDTRSLVVEPVAFPLAEHGLTLLVVDSKAPHALVDGQYGERRSSCEAAAKALGVAALRDITLAGLDEALDRLPDDVTRRRARHVITEDARVLDVVRILRAGEDPRAIGPVLTASHLSMRDDFEITVPPVDLAVQTALEQGAHGARMTGGGFGGCVIALVDSARADQVFGAVAEAFARAGFTAPVRVPARASDGARRLA